MRPLLLLALLVAPLPGLAQGAPKVETLMPEPACEAPAFAAAASRQVLAEEDPPPFRRALLACQPFGEPKSRLRRT